jgi:hypothetical protein
MYSVLPLQRLASSGGTISDIPTELGGLTVPVTIFETFLGLEPAAALLVPVDGSCLLVLV